MGFEESGHRCFTLFEANGAVGDASIDDSIKPLVKPP
jgi:hypothetical protein